MSNRKVLACAALMSFALASAAANAAFLVTGTYAYTTAYAGAAGAPWDSKYESSSALGLLYQNILSSGDTHVGVPYGETAEASADAEVYFEAFGSSTLYGFGDIRGLARQNSARIEYPNGTSSWSSSSAASSATALVGINFRVTTPYSYQLLTSETSPLSKVTLQDQYGRILGATGVLDPTLFYYISGSASGTANASSICGSVFCSDSYQGFDSRWSFDLYATPVPLPAGVWLLISGFGVVGAAVKKRRR